MPVRFVLSTVRNPELDFYLDREADHLSSSDA
jgi:hypothetical protein